LTEDVRQDSAVEHSIHATSISMQCRYTQVQIAVNEMQERAT